MVDRDSRVTVAMVPRRALDTLGISSQKFAELIFAILLVIFITTIGEKLLRGKKQCGH